VVIEALAAGASFGLFFIVFDQTAEGSAPWPVVGARLLTSVVLVLYLLSRRESILPADSTGRSLVAATGIFDTGSNVLFLYALQVGDLTTVSVLSSLYPVATVLLARAVLDERMTKIQLVGFVIAMAATTCIALG